VSAGTQVVLSVIAEDESNMSAKRLALCMQQLGCLGK
jgi:hypothetical protein